VLADRIGLATSLAAGDYSRAWNEITVSSDEFTKVSNNCVSGVALVLLHVGCVADIHKTRFASKLSSNAEVTSVIRNLLTGECP